MGGAHDKLQYFHEKDIIVPSKQITLKSSNAILKKYDNSNFLNLS